MEVDLMDNSLLFAGIDLHKKYCFMTLMDQSGVVLKEAKVPNEEALLLSFFEGFDSKIYAAVEATANWYWLIDLLNANGIQTSLANPLKVRVIAESRIKTDKIDARVLANLLRMNYLPVSYIADKQTRDHREYLRNRIFMVRIQTAIKNRVHKFLDKQNIQHTHSDLFAPKGINFLRQLELPQKTQESLDSLLGLQQTINKELLEIKKSITLSTQQNHLAKLLMSIPGVGQLSALMILHEIGDFKRFNSPKKLASYAGLATSTYSSGGKTYHGHITKQGNKILRWVLVQAAASVIRHKKDRRLMRFYERIRYKKNAQIAMVALAKEILTIAYFLVKKDEEYNPFILYKNSNHPAWGANPA
jgi:transposase